jgi:ABC-type Fe3+ transport system permease subunit
MKSSPRSTRIVIWVLVGVVVIMTAIALTIPTPSTQTSDAQGTMVGADSGTPQSPSEVGSTDGIVILAALIALIITVPIILRWKDWMRKNKGPASPDHNKTAG